MSALRWIALMPLLAIAAPASSAEPAPSTSLPPVEDLIELDEVKIRGKLVANAVIAMENRVFRLYNNLNPDRRFDVHCQDVRVRDSLALLRICLPDFIDYRPHIPYAGTFSGPGYGSMSAWGNMTSGVDYYGNMYSTLSYPIRGPFGGINQAAASYAYYPVATPRPVVANGEQIAEFKQAMVRVMNSDPELQRMAAELAGMYNEVDRIQARYEELREERRAAQRAKRVAARERGVELWPPHPRKQ